MQPACGRACRVPKSQNVINFQSDSSSGVTAHPPLFAGPGLCPLRKHRGASSRISLNCSFLSRLRCGASLAGHPGPGGPASVRSFPAGRASSSACAASGGPPAERRCRPGLPFGVSGNACRPPLPLPVSWPRLGRPGKKNRAGSPAVRAWRTAKPVFNPALGWTARPGHQVIAFSVCSVSAARSWAGRYAGLPT